MEGAKNRKRRGDKEWAHKSLCMYHDIYPMAKSFYDEAAIPESHWKICQCGKFDSIINQCDWKYRAGLNEIIKAGAGTRKGAYYTDLNININNQFYKVQLLSMQAGEIKKSTQPTTRKKRLGTGTFHEGAFIQELGVKGGTKGTDAGPYYIQWRLKNRFTRNRIEIKKGETSKDVADWWYQNWSVHGLREQKNVNLNTKQFVAIHNNIFVGGTSREECEGRIVLYVYAGNGAPDIETMEINGKVLKSKIECEMIRKQMQEKKRKKMERKRKRKRHEMESEWMGGSQRIPIKVEDDEENYSDDEHGGYGYGYSYGENQNCNNSQSNHGFTDELEMSLDQQEEKERVAESQTRPSQMIEMDKWRKMWEEERQKNQVMREHITKQDEHVEKLKQQIHKLKIQNEKFKQENKDLVEQISISNNVMHQVSMDYNANQEQFMFTPAMSSVNQISQSQNTTSTHNSSGTGKNGLINLDFNALTKMNIPGLTDLSTNLNVDGNMSLGDIGNINVNELLGTLGMLGNDINNKIVNTNDNKTSCIASNGNLVLPNLVLNDDNMNHGELKLPKLDMYQYDDCTNKESSRKRQKLNNGGKKSIMITNDNKSKYSQR